MFETATAFAALEVKFAPEGRAGTFEGYGSIFGNVDAHGDMILPGAFQDSISQRKAQGRGLPMYAQHGFSDTLPVGVWHDFEEDTKGLRMRGEIAAMDTDHGRRIYGLVKAGALSGLSIGYRIPKNGAAYGSKPGEPRRTIKKVDLFEVSLVDDPSNALARVEAVKSQRRQSRPDTIREFEDFLRDAGYSRSEAERVAAHGFKSLRGEPEASAASTMPSPCAEDEVKHMLNLTRAFRLP